MKKNFKKGFFLPETIVVITVVAVVLLNVYVVFTSVYSNYNRSSKYNTLNSLNAAYSLIEYYASLGDIDTSNLESNNYMQDITNKSAYSSEFYQKLKANYDIKKVYLTIPKNAQNNLSNYDVNLRRFIKTMRNTEEEGIVVVLNNGEYAYLPLNATGESNI